MSKLHYAYALKCNLTNFTYKLSVNFDRPTFHILKQAVINNMEHNNSKWKDCRKMELRNLPTFQNKSTISGVLDIQSV